MSFFQVNTGKEARGLKNKHMFVATVYTCLNFRERKFEIIFLKEIESRDLRISSFVCLKWNQLCNNKYSVCNHSTPIESGNMRR